MAKFSALLLCFTLILCLLVGSAMADPSVIDDMELPELDKRQDNNSTSVVPPRSPTSSATSTHTSPSSPTSPPPSNTPPPTPPNTPPTTPPPPPPPTTPPATPTPPPPPTLDPPVQSTLDTPVETVPPNPTTRTIVSTIFTTISRSDGVVTTSAILSSHTTVENPAAGAQTGNSNGSITPATKKTIIGVVVGIGGALLFGGLAIVAWRLKRKNKNPVDEDDLMRREGSPLAARRDMHATNPEQSPFKATLDQYHKPPGVVSASSNF